ncbi:hypothetical protein HMPREF0758_3664 [Serratia odorifera DSM 4582]|uniref:Uncharacterized protein n=1 Tax=Serratia odorifera DSM 4582 TaxID=667129 RepID=D4E664_SEROD|nr:hypothetical protein HMPREF0758_3664 [Serratia odorifera DSM 4582]
MIGCPIMQLRAVTVQVAPRIVRLLCNSYQLMAIVLTPGSAAVRPVHRLAR